MQNKTYRILAKNQMVSNDTWYTGLNNNDLIIGPSGAGKTRGYVKPNILQCNESMIITDTKGTLIKEAGGTLKKNGYKVWNLDFKNLHNSCGYNPLDYIRYDKKREKYVEQDIMTVVESMISVENKDEPFWEMAARMYLASIIGYVLECLPEREHTMEYVAKLFSEMGTGNFERLFAELNEINPNSFAAKKYNMYKNAARAEKMYESIRGVLAQKLDPMSFDSAVEMFQNPNKIKFSSLCKEKTAIFLNISDTDRSQDTLANLFYVQALQVLCNCADKNYPDHKLEIPVRIILDDFATNTYIPYFDKIISVIRSREIYVSIILQSISQLESMYGHAKAMTIINNCDHCLYLGGQDVETAQYISVKANKVPNTVLNMPLEEAYLFTRGAEPQKVRKYQ